MRKSSILLFLFVLLYSFMESKSIPGLLPITNEEKVVIDSLVQNNQVEIFSEINKKSKSINVDNFSFLVSGHFHGSSSSKSGMPASTLLANLDSLNKMNLDFMICLGDLFLNIENDHDNFEKYFFQKLNSPLFNAVGNHDIDNDFYKSNYGPTFQTFEIGENRFILLDTELDNGSITEAQLELFKKAISSNERIKNIFIFMHRTLWAEKDDEFSELFPDNTKSTVANNFESTIFPMIKSASKNSNVYLFSGSIGGMAPASFFFHPYSKKIFFIATAIRDLPRDAVLLVNSKNGKISFTTFSLTSKKVLSLEKYTIDWWIRHKSVEKSFNWRLVPLYIWQMITHRYFWYGLSFTFLFYLIYKFKQRGKKA